MKNKNNNTKPSPFYRKGSNEGDDKENAWGRAFGNKGKWGEDEWGIKKAEKDLDASFEDFQGLKEGAGENLFAGAENKLDLSNTFEDLTVGEGFDYEKDQVRRSTANVLDAFKGSSGSSGNAGLAQQLMESSLSANQRIGDQITTADRANQLLSAKQIASNQLAMGQADMDVQKIQLQGDADARDLQIGMQQAELSYLAGLKESSEANKDQDTAGKYNSSDRRLKKNISKIGESASGLNIYSFEYKNPLDGEGLFQGVMSDEVPQQAVINNEGYDMVNYGMLDVEFKQI